MANVFKQLTANDRATTKTLLREAIPLTGSLASGSYGTHPSEENIKNFAHGMFQNVYDYPYLSSSANEIFSITVGFSADSALSRSAPHADSQQAKKINIWNQMALTLMGTDETGSIQPFDRDGNILAGGAKLRECFFLCFNRLLYKDEIQKGSFTIKLGSTAAYAQGNNTQLTITDAGAQNSFLTNSPAGEYGILSASAGEGSGGTGTPSGLVGLLFYQAGVAVLTASVFAGVPTGSLISDAILHVAGPQNITASLTGSEISGCADQFRNRLVDVTFNNTIELNSSIYYIRVNHNEFNYSSNPTYLSSSKIVTKTNSTDEPTAYITGVGLYSSDNELLAIAKLSEPLKKTPSTELTLRVRTDF